MSFSFNFTGDDIEDDPKEHSAQNHVPKAIDSSGTNPAEADGPEVPVAEHDLTELLETLPSQISYTTTLITSPQHSRTALIPRRALFDVRMQIMAEDDPSPARASDALGMGASDLESNVYEGGFKSWEGAHDLAQLVLDRGPRKDIDELAGLDRIIELGCGTALPTLALFAHALRAGHAPALTLADYNASVLRLVTLPNLLLTWALHAAPEAFSPAPPAANPRAVVVHGDGELDAAPALRAAFVADLARRGIAVALVSGPWGAAGLRAALQAPLHEGMAVLVLAAETVYSPGSLAGFADVLSAVLGAVRAGKALVAAKRIYFGVGGGVDAFKEAMAARGGIVSELMGTGIEACDRGGAGVGRCLMEVQMA